MATAQTLGELAAIEGVSGAAVFTPAGDLLASCGGDDQLESVGRLADSVLHGAERAAQAIGAGRGRQVHVAGDRAHVLVRCLDEEADPAGARPGKAHIHLVLILAADASVGFAKERMAASMRALADELR
jgi:predicted regulator of Ras-like GTPase activity (Roadblock/LC7/MglB family)